MKRIIFPTITTLMLAGATWSVRAADTNNVPATDGPAATPATGSSTADSFKPAMDADVWQFGLTIPLWAPQIDGNATVRGHQENVKVNFNTLRQHLDAVFSTAVEAHKGKFSIYGDVGYMKFSISQSHVGPDGHAHVNSWAGLKFLDSDLAGGYQLIKTESEHPFILEGTAGVRYWYASMPVSFSDANGNTLFAGSKTWNLVDPVIGFRGSQYFTQKFHLDFAANGGGFNISHNTDWTWGASGELTYDFVKWFSLSAGYQALALDEAEGSGASKNGVNVIFNGVLVAATFNF
jgi:hypothetical protein